ncbi:hypothetical protein TNCV_4424281 [Trichonephila clavipes]|nr:hypothetical protein TNCV_4424281 [Trichonephila clavipes]
MNLRPRPLRYRSFEERKSHRGDDACRGLSSLKIFTLGRGMEAWKVRHLFRYQLELALSAGHSTLQTSTTRHVRTLSLDRSKRASYLLHDGSLIA